MKKVLFLVHHRVNRSPGQRFRFEQYIDFLEQNGFQCTISNLMDEVDDLDFYGNKILPKVKVLVKAFSRRVRDIARRQNYDIIFIFREAFFFGDTWFLKLLKTPRSKVIFDFDDAIFLPNVSSANKSLAFLKNPEKTAKLIQLSDMVFAGNEYLANYAKEYNNNVIIIPTTVDTDKAKKILNKKKIENNKICIGWTGSLTTIQHFEIAIPFLHEIKKKYEDKIYFKVIGDASFENKELGIKGIAWNSKTELEDLVEIDIGIMPLPDDEWAKGKCGFKLIQYMALEIPGIASPVGVNKNIIEDGINGYLVSTSEEWINKLTRLIESEELRIEIGREGRKTVEAKYSISAQKEKYLQNFQKVLSL